jgi:hypothetical protein
MLCNEPGEELTRAKVSAKLEEGGGPGIGGALIEKSSKLPPEAVRPSLGRPWPKNEFIVFAIDIRCWPKGWLLALFKCLVHRFMVLR